MEADRFRGEEGSERLASAMELWLEMPWRYMVWDW